MSASMKRTLYWTPRVMGILFALFLSLFALDVIGVGLRPWETIVAVLIHLVPVYLVILALAIAWRWEWAGAVLFSVLAALYLVWGWGRFEWSAYAVISGPLLLLAVLFLLGWIYRAELRTR